ncbi:hypothetical protein BDW68DRAFT_180382 [Aspergillus falconensis]
MALPAFKIVFGYEYQGELLIDAKWNALWTAMTSIGMILGGVVCGSIFRQLGQEGGHALGIYPLHAFIPHKTNAKESDLDQRKSPWASSSRQARSTCPKLPHQTPVRAHCNGQLLHLRRPDDRHWYRQHPLRNHDPIRLQGRLRRTVAFPGAILLFLIILPESPRYLVRKNRLDTAEKSLKALHAPEYNITAATAAISALRYEMLAEAKDTAISSASAHQSVSYLDCFRGPNWRRTRIACRMFLIQQFSGIALYARALYFLGISGFSLQLSFQLALGGFGAGLLGNAISWFATAYIGRRPMLFTGTLINLAALLTVGIAGIFSTSKAAMLHIAIMINFVQLVYAPTIGAVSWCIGGEISSVALREDAVPAHSDQRTC